MAKRLQQAEDIIKDLQLKASESSTNDSQSPPTPSPTREEASNGEVYTSLKERERPYLSPRSPLMSRAPTAPVLVTVPVLNDTGHNDQINSTATKNWLQNILQLISVLMNTERFSTTVRPLRFMTPSNLTLQCPSLYQCLSARLPLTTHALLWHHMLESRQCGKSLPSKMSHCRLAFLVKLSPSYSIYIGPGLLRCSCGFTNPLSFVCALHPLP